MGGSKNGGSSSTSQTLRYAPYIEKIHTKFLGSGTPNSKLVGLFNAALDQSPYDTYTALPVDDAFFGDGYAITNFPALYDVFLEFMKDVDVIELWDGYYESVVKGPEVSASIAAHSALVQDELDTTVIPKFLAGMRDINAVHSSTFVMGKAVIADGHVKAVNKFAAEIRLRMIDVATKLLSVHLDWNKSVAQVYLDYAKVYFDIKSETERARLEYAAKDELWNLNLLDYARAMIGALNGAAAAKSDKEPSVLQKVLGGALSGAAAGASLMTTIAPALSMGGPIGAGIGGLLGIAGAFM